MKKLFPVIYVFLCSLGANSFAGGATWSSNPVSDDWNTAANWTPNTVPNGPADVATFATSDITELVFSAIIQTNEIIFNPGASAFTLMTADSGQLTISGTGITNNSGITQNFVTNNFAPIYFSGLASAGNQMVFTNRGSTASNPESGFILFLEESNAGQATFINNPAEVVGFGIPAGQMGFINNSSAANGTFICNGASVAGAYAGFLYFNDEATAGNGTFILNGGTVSGADGGYVTFYGGESTTGGGNATFILNGGAVGGARGGNIYFYKGSQAEDATIIANSGSGGGEGGTIHFTRDSQGMGTRVELFGNGKLNISSHDGSGVTIGSLEGDGLVLLGKHNLSIGANNLPSKFAGVISQTGPVTKVGSGNLTLSGASTYSGGTTIRNGSLLIANMSGSATGSGLVSVQHGRLGGLGVIAGSVSVGTAAGSSFLVPGDRKTLGILTIQGQLALSAYATYDFAINSSQAASDGVAAQGVTINSATLLYADNGTATLPPGTVFTVISNTSADPIAGVFNNLLDGATVTIGSNTYQADYEGGDGNDLTLTVVP